MPSPRISGSALLWDATTGREIFTRTDSGASIVAVAFSPDGTRIAAGLGFYVNREFQGRCTIWDVASGAKLASLPGPPGGVQGLAFSTDGKWLASAGWDQTVRLWDAASGRMVRTLEIKGGGEWAGTVAFSPDSKWLVAAGELVPAGLDEAGSAAEPLRYPTRPTSTSRPWAQCARYTPPRAIRSARAPARG